MLHFLLQVIVFCPLVWRRLPGKNVPHFSEIGIILPHGEAVDKLYAEWQEQSTFKINVLKEPYTDAFGQTFLIKDPDGHIIRVCFLD